MTTRPQRSRLVAIAGAVTAALALTVTLIVSTSHNEPEPARPDEPISTFWASIHAELTLFAALDRQGIRYDRPGMLRLTGEVCTALALGVSRERAALAVARSGWPPYDAGFIVGATANTVCKHR